MRRPITREDVTVVTVTYDSAHCIADLARFLGSMPHVTVVDNASSDGTVEAVRRMLPRARVVCNPRNLGFGAANNAALHETSTSHALLLNPDCDVSDGAMEALLDGANRYPDAAVIAPHLLSRAGDVELNYRWPSTHWTSRGAAAEGDCCVGFVCGAAMLLNLHAMREVGFFDEQFFLYYEDDDLCSRIFGQKKQIILLPDVHITHFSRGSVRGTAPMRAEYLRGYHHAQSKIIFARKHLGRPRAEKLKRRTLALAIAALLPRLVVPVPRHLARLVGRIRGLIDYRID